MNEIFDKLIIKILITSFLLLIIFSYRYSLKFFLNKSKSFSLKGVYPSKNPAHAFHISSRVLGLAIILSDFSFYLSDGLFMALFDFFIYSFALITLFSFSVYIFESIALYNFSFEDEIYKRKNISTHTFSKNTSYSRRTCCKRCE